MTRPNWPRCPRCRSRNVKIIELWSGQAMTWEPDSAIDDGAAGDTGDPYKVQGECLVCGHTWTLRGIIQIDPQWWVA